jgi:phospholipase/carboxylesterase
MVNWNKPPNHMRTTFLLGFIIIATLTIAAMSSRNKPADTPVAEKAPLYYLVKKPSIPSEKPPLLVLLHGVGADETDLFSLANNLDGRFLVVSARAPFTIAPGSYKWYTVNFTGGTPQVDPVEAEKSRQVILEFLKSLQDEQTFDSQQVYLCGFSQGAIMSYSIALTAPEQVAGIIALSGRVLDQATAQMAPPEKLRNVQILILHGTDDQVLPIHYARQAKALFTNLGIPFEYHELPIGHTISAATIQHINTWLAAR